MKHKFNRKYGLNVYNQQPEELFEYASSNGIHFMEINLSQEQFSIKTYDASRIKKLLDLSKLYNIKLSFHIPFYINIADILPYYRNTHIRHIVKCVQIASELRATHVTMHIGNFYWFPIELLMRKNALKRFIKSLEGVLKVCEEEKIIIALENVAPIKAESEHYLLGDNIEDFNFIFESVNSKYLKFCLDTGHANMGEGVLEYINNFHSKLSCIHYHDNNGAKDEHLAVGDGTVPWEDLAEELINIDYQGPIISECSKIEAHEAAILFENYFDKFLSNKTID